MKTLHESEKELPYVARRGAVLRKVRGAHVKAVLISCPEDVGYLSGFTGDDSFLLMGEAGRGDSSRPAQWVCLITDGRYSEQANKECRGIEVHVHRGQLPEAVAALLKGRRVRRLAVQAEHLTLQRRSVLEKGLKGKSLVGIDDLVKDLRQIKDAVEVKAIRKAIRVAENAFRTLLAGGLRGFVGRTERQVAAELDYQMRLAGADRPAFETIVAAGAHGSLPHYRPGETRIRRGQPVLIDWGARVQGYCSDLTRVVLLGRIPPKLVRIYQVVLRAQAAGMAAVRPGISGKTADAAARKVVEAAGYGQQFVHGLGHGLGREVHEGPSLGRFSGMRLRAGMVVTVEPGIYLPGVGGVRIEDDVLVGSDGQRRLSSLPRALAAMTL